MKQVIKKPLKYYVLVRKSFFKTYSYGYYTKHEAMRAAEKYLNRNYFVKIEKA